MVSGEKAASINIVIPANIDYYEAAIIMLRSLLFNNRDSEIAVYLFHAELDEKRIAGLRRLIERNNGVLHVIKVNDDVMKNVPVGSLSKETYYRLLAPELLPEELDRVLYLDLDMIITGDISTIYHADFQDNLFMAVPDTSLGIDETKKKLRLKNDAVYINAGVLLMNLELLRKEFDLQKALDYAIKHAERVLNCDQDVINVLYGDRIGYLEWKYNYEARFHSVSEIVLYPFRMKQLLAKIKIIHYMGSKKPWRAGFNGKYLREYYFYARHTAYEKTIRKNIQNRIINCIKLIQEMSFIWAKKKIQSVV